MKSSIHKHAAAGLAAIALAMPALAQMPFAPLEGAAPAASPACANMRVAVYFPAHDTGLTPQSERVIDEASQQLKGCRVKAVAVNVLSEEAHTDEDAAALSEARATNVMAALFENGIEPDIYKADYSRMDAAAPGAVPMVEPMARRVSVEFEVGPGYGV